MNKVVFLSLCLKAGSICASVQINTKVIPGKNYYEAVYCLGERELKDSICGDLEEEKEQGIFLEDIRSYQQLAKKNIYGHECSVTYLPLEATFTEPLYEPNLRKSIITFSDKFEPLSFSGNASCIAFHLNNFRYGLNLNSNQSSGELDFNLGKVWNAKLLDNKWVYTEENPSVYDATKLSKLWVEYKVVEIQEIDAKIKRYTIEWRGLRSYYGATWQWDRYSKRHGRIIIDSNGELKEFVIYMPKLIQGFDICGFTYDKKRKGCLTITKITEDKWKILRGKYRGMI